MDYTNQEHFYLSRFNEYGEWDVLSLCGRGFGPWELGQISEAGMSFMSARCRETICQEPRVRGSELEGTEV